MGMISGLVWNQLAITVIRVVHALLHLISVWISSIPDIADAYPMGTEEYQHPLGSKKICIPSLQP